ncbi:enoyl-CoA hydratase/isomerase family protein [Paenibacillus sp. WQ 127069]|uniref:Enoyl-CoA hydratase/isomerase family protein n=1 Tax=Paenibacillus baimaensis TaxID=2982185 RepID=A0ABT2UCZ5_9BACL|nr:enoyl-CoA hydratase/isomerase family protein [Paenibacillus sp. WQ 127069]MCU6792510.1 enoyl-CoA hydratase/isomerase family protein [Paenibacillus sp. WQ 127069]
MPKENLPEWFQRYEPSNFGEYSEKYKDIMLMTRKNGILEVKMHTDGGPLKYVWSVHEAWGKAWREIGADHENEVIIVTGSGDKWLVGDPDAWKVPLIQWSADAKLKMRMESQKLMENFVFGIDVPVIAAVNGPGVHVEFSALADITLVTEDVDFWDPHFLAGVVPGDGMGLVLQKTIGIKRAAYYAITGKRLDGKTAVELGLANEVVPREKILDRAWELAEYMMDRPRAARALTHGVLMRPWKQALVDDQVMHGNSITLGLCMDEVGPLERLKELKQQGRI